MKAIVQSKYGPPDVLALQEIDKPVVKQNEVLIRVRAASANPQDWHFLRGLPYILRLQSGLRSPTHVVLGSDIAGQVEAVGENVSQLRAGDDVYAHVATGGFAEYTSVAEDFVSLKPANLTFEQAAAVPLAAMTALQGLRDAGQLKPGQKVLIIGASGGVGTFAVQIAKALGADVTGVCSTRNVQMVRSLGAGHVIDYTQEDFTEIGQKYDLILQLAGTRSPSDCRRALTENGTLVLSSGESSGDWIGPMDRIIKAVVLSRFVSQTLGPFVARRSRDDLEYLTQLIEADKLTPVIDRVYSLGETSDAVRYLGEGHTQGKVVIAV